MNRPNVIGIVGGIGSGKSEVGRLLAEGGGRLILADQLGHEALLQPENRERVFARWPSVRGEDGEVDRRRLGRIVFANPEELAGLEAISFPWIGARIREELSRTAGWSVLDAAIMLETGWNKVCDRIVYVHTPRAQRLQRVASRGWDDAELRRREAAQWPLARKALAADHAIINDGSLTDLRERVSRMRATFGLLAGHCD